MSKNVNKGHKCQNKVESICVKMRKKALKIESKAEIVTELSCVITESAFRVEKSSVHGESVLR